MASLIVWKITPRCFTCFFVSLLLLTFVIPFENTNIDRTKDCQLCQDEYIDKYFCDAKKRTEKHRCIHSAYPFDILGKISRSRELSQGVKAQVSSNVFMENLHKTKNLAKTYYVTDNKQTMEFIWVRESGLQIHIGIHDIHLVPEYYDVTYDSDNRNVLHNQQQSLYSSEDLNKFRNIINNYCRHPIPNDYTLTMEINRDRTTVAKHFKCDSANSRLPPCPSHLNDGDYFLYRSTNEACQKMGTFPQPLLPTSNSIVCTQDTDLLKNVFHKTHRTERPIRFPPRRCRQSESKCQECLSKLMCNSSENLEANCCQIDCYSLQDCKVAFNPECTSNPIQCAMGDAYRYTTRPNFAQNFDEFQCHIRHRSQKTFYEMFYHIKIPGPFGQNSGGIETQKSYKNIPFNARSQSKYTTSYIHVEHNTGLEAYSDVILHGQYGDHDDVDFTFHKMNSEMDYVNNTFDVVEVNPNVYVTTAQVTSPFMHSTASWSRDNACDKDITKLKTPQKHYKSKGEKVNAYINKNKSDTAYNYLLKSIDKQPYIRFKVSGSESILSHYFDETKVGLLLHSTIKVHLEQSRAIWSIHVSGRTSACPAFIHIIVDDLLVRAEVGHYDLLVFCPSNFNMTVKIPRPDLHSDRSFKVTIGDSKATHSYYVSALVINGGNRDLSLSRRNVFKEYDHSYGHIFIIVGVTVASVCILHIATAFFEVTTVQKVSFKFSEPSRRTWTDLRNSSRTPTPAYCKQDSIPNDLHRKTKTRGQYAFIFMYIALKVIYSFLITFTSVLTLLTVVLQKDIQVLSNLPVFQREKYNQSRFLIQDINEFAHQELLRQDKLLFTANKACANYLAQRFDEILQRITEKTINADQDRSPALVTVTQRLDSLFKHRKLQYERLVNKYTSSLHVNFTKLTKPVILNYKKYLTTVCQNNWMQFPKLLFNKSDFRSDRPTTFRTTHLSGEEVDFGAFLPVDEVETVQLWSLNWWERYRITMPHMTGRFIPKPANNCRAKVDKNMTSWSLDAFYSRVNSSLFFTVDIYEDLKMPSDGFTDKIPISEDPRTHLGDIVNDYRRALDINAVWILFIILDALMLFYRFNHIFFNAHLLFYGFDEYSFVNDKPQEHYITEQFTQNRCLTNDIAGQDLYMNNVEEKIEFLTSIPSTTNFEKCRTKCNKYDRRDTFKPKYLGFYSSDFCSKNTALEYMQSPTVPKVVIGLVVLVQVILVNEFISVILSAEFLYDLDGFRIFLVGLDVQVNRTNWHLQEQAKYYNEISLEAYKEQLNSELIQFQRLLKFFNLEQDRIMSNHLKESCSIERNLHDNRTCDLRVSMPKINITLLPCGIMPIQARNYQGFNRDSHKFQLVEDFEPYLASTHDVIIKASYVIVIVLAVTLIIHVTGVVIFKFLKTRHKFPVNRIYVTKSQSVVMETDSNKMAASNQATDEEAENETMDETNDSDKLSVDILQTCSNVSADEDFEDFIETKV